jgi:hypothetical protein
MVHGSKQSRTKQKESSGCSPGVFELKRHVSRSNPSSLFGASQLVASLTGQMIERRRHPEEQPIYGSQPRAIGLLHPQACFPNEENSRWKMML